ncbi:hypothetical protein L810_6996 [Burkholderia sp. AU4i]|uniref:hypothetical protein n=1 Tax=Burkholderia sp. AU4i TaxID=1335308 RepID=UPI000398B888|nr:hypothetical protein [Burkholderia sp. AU4i]ERJ38779.1 hypothetical protein L810_6996 [Burkholderia sp. AU4i]
MTLDELNLPAASIPVSLRGRLEVEMTDNSYPQVGIAHDGVFITEPYFDVGMADSAVPSDYGLTAEEADFIVETNQRLACRTQS